MPGVDPRPVTSYDVARRAEVSQSTVSRALRDDPRVVEATRERIRSIAVDMGYVPHFMARSLITRRSSSIAVISGDLRNPSYPTLVNALQDEFALHDHRVILMSDRTEGSHDKDIEALRGGLVDGVVLIAARVETPVVPQLVRWRIPLVVLNRDVDALDAQLVDRVTSDNATGGRLVADHLVDLGHRRIGLVGGPLDNPSIVARERGFRDGLAARGLALDDALVRRGPVDPPTAVFCVSDYVAMGVCDAAARLRRRVPDDVQVVGYNDLEFAGWSMFDLTTVRQPLDEMARTAARTLLARIEGDDGPPVHRSFDVELVRRGSTQDLARG